MPVSLDEARAWLRLGATDEDVLIERLIDAAVNICEVFIGQWLIVREGEEIVPLRRGVARLVARPVVGIDAVTLIAADSSEGELDGADFSADIVDGAARVIVSGASAGSRVRIAFRAGLAETAAGVPEAIRHGILRMTQHLYRARDGEEGAPPAAIAALWRPWRRLTLGAEG